MVRDVFGLHPESMKDEEIRKLRTELAQAQENNKKLLCTYCGHLSQKTGDWNKDREYMVDHMLQCEKSPAFALVKAEQARDLAEAKCADIKDAIHSALAKLEVSISFSLPAESVRLIREAQRVLWERSGTNVGQPILDRLKALERVLAAASCVANDEQTGDMDTLREAIAACKETP